MPDTSLPILELGVIPEFRSFDGLSETFPELGRGGEMNHKRKSIFCRKSVDLSRLHPCLPIGNNSGGEIAGCSFLDKGCGGLKKGSLYLLSLPYPLPCIKSSQNAIAGKNPLI